MMFSEYIVHSFFREKKTHKNNIEMIAFTFIALNFAMVGVVFEQCSFMEIVFVQRKINS